MKRLSNNGFTLVELLVTISMLGVVSVMSIPILRNVSNKNESSKHQVYTKSLLESSRLYNDTYSEDLFGDESFGCREISYEELASKFLLKDIDIENETCNTKDTYVRIIKINDKYNFTASLTCTDKDGHQVYSENNIKTSIKCEKQTVNGPAISFITPVLKDKVNNRTKNKEITIIINSNYGIKENSKIYYNFSTTADGLNLISSWKEYKLNKKTEEKPGWTKSFKVNTKSLPSGEYYLVIKTINSKNQPSLLDAAGNRSSQQEYISEPLIVDKEGPLIENSTVEYTNTNKTEIKYVLNGAHDKINGIAIKVCLSENDHCENYKEYNNATLKLKKRSKIVNVFLKDLSGNITKNPIVLK